MHKILPWFFGILVGVFVGFGVSSLTGNYEAATRFGIAAYALTAGILYVLVEILEKLDKMSK